MLDIGLFPLGLVLLPHERVPLHIFEERYKELIGECVESDRPFGLILSEDDERADVGTMAEVDEVTQRFSDGRLNVIVTGRARFRVVAETSGRAFATASVEEISDDDQMPTDEETEALLSAFAALAEAAEAEAPTIATDAPQLSFRLAALVELENGPRQELLELNSERERTRSLTRLFSDLAKSIHRQRDVRKRAESNGRVEPRD